MKFLDLFAGIGGFRLGLEQSGHECVGYVEWDKYARKSYEAIHDTEGEWTAHDITTITDDDLRSLANSGIELISGGFPCQSFSVAGKRGGFDDTRGTMFFEIARIAKQIKPRILLLENVKGLLSHDKGNTFGTILHTLDELGYDCEWQVLNSKNFGVPQNRERVFIVGYLRGFGRSEIFPIGGENEETGCINTNLKINEVGKLYPNRHSSLANSILSTDGLSPALDAMRGGSREPKIVIPVLTPDREEKRQQGRRFKEPGDPSFTINTQDRHGVAIYDFSESKREGKPRIYTEYAPTLRARDYKDPRCVSNGYQIRKLTPRECWRLQGFPDWAFKRAAEVNSNSQLYKQAGNSVTVNVIYEIGKRLI